jgi:glycerol-3-phosphate dehydrogenase
MNRTNLLSKISTDTRWDVVVVGGGATGLGVALEASTRGYRTLLVEQHDFCKGTSSRSTKLVHGGVRYLSQGNLRLVRDALRERGLLLKNAPGLVRPLRLVVPIFSRWERLYYGTGLRFYDLLAGKLGLSWSQGLSVEATIEKIPTLKPDSLRGGILYLDAAFDDSRMGIALARNAAGSGAVLVNYMRFAGFLKSDEKVCGVRLCEQFGGAEFEARARVVVNATGVFSDAVREMDSPREPRMLALSQGTHLVLPKRFLPRDFALMIPKTEDGRVLFALPWHNRVLAGTTDVAVAEPQLEPRPGREEIRFILEHLGHYLTERPTEADILSTFSGLRPLIQTRQGRTTAALGRDHSILVSNSSLVSILGGKWTTYRKMAEDAVDRAAEVGGLPQVDSCTADISIEGPEVGDLYWPSGNDELGSLDSALEDTGLQEPLDADFPYTKADVVRAVREEWACTLEDVLARRTRLLFLDARAAVRAGPQVASIITAELGHGSNWESEQVKEFIELAKGYLPEGAMTP